MPLLIICSLATTKTYRPTLTKRIVSLTSINNIPWSTEQINDFLNAEIFFRYDMVEFQDVDDLLDEVILYWILLSLVQSGWVKVDVVVGSKACLQERHSV